MSRSTTSLAVVVGALAAIIVGTAAVGPLSADPGAPAVGTTTAASPRPGAPTAGMSAQERLAYDAHRDSVTLDPVTGGPGTADLQRPNVLVLMTDDMRDDDLQYMPNVQQL
ncbi:MAG: hypothetical protein ACTHKG_18885, partial [Nocardioides sp.]